MTNRLIAPLVLFALGACCLAAAAQTGRTPPLHAWAPQPVKLAPYLPPNKPLKKLTDILARHAGKADWAETEILTRDYIGQYISMGPGQKTKTQFWADDRVFWWVYGGRMKVTIEGQEPFIASKGFLVQVPYRVPYSMETVGDEPSLRFEITRGHTLPSYPLASGDKPPAAMGQHYVKVSYPSTPVGGGMDSYTDKNQPYLDFMKDYVQADPTASGKGRLHFFVSDADNQAAIIRGMGVAIPPDSNKGHFHIGNDEFWFILEGKIAYQFEGVGLVVAQAGDLVLAMPGRWHRASFAPGQVDTRLAFNRSPTMLHNYTEDANGTQ
jgi:mannose-6-phosphate isomerase-like protein (cupin superfamily)